MQEHMFRFSMSPGLRLPLAFWIVWLGSIATGGEDRPDQTEQERILGIMRESSASYHLPDVSYDVTLTLSGSGGWRYPWEKKPLKTDGRLIAHDGRVYLCCRLGAHNKPIPNQWMETPGSEHFGRRQFPWDGSHANIEWSRWDIVRGHKVAVFNYTVSQQDSLLPIPDSVDATRIPRQHGGRSPGVVPNLHDAPGLPYKGSLWVDPSTGVIRRASVAVDIPDGSSLRHLSWEFDFDEVVLGTQQFAVPVLCNLVSTEKGKDTRWATFRLQSYRKFEVDSSITFFPVDSTTTYPH